MDGDFKARFTIPQSLSHGFKGTARPAKDQATRNHEWNELIRRRGKAYARVSLTNRDGIPFQLHGSVEDKARQRDVIAQLTRYGQTMLDRVMRGQGLVFTGGTGTGKDHCLMALARPAILKHGFTVAWIDGAAFFSQLRDRIGEGLSERGVIRPLIEADILILSDPVPASGTLSDFQRDRLFDVIDKRAAAGKPTWVSCNFATGDEASAVLSPQLHGRLKHKALVLGFSWPSWRQAAPKDGEAADEWWGPFEPDEEQDAPGEFAPPTRHDDLGNFPDVTREQLRDPAAVDDLFSECVRLGLVAFRERREFFQAAAHASIVRRRCSPRAMLAELLRERAWTGQSRVVRLIPKCAERGNAMLAEASKLAKTGRAIETV